MRKYERARTTIIAKLHAVIEEIDILELDKISLIEKATNDIEKLKDRQREFANGNGKEKH